MLNVIDFSHALIIDEPWISLILSGEKTWEMRSKSTKIRGKIGLIKKGSGLIVGTAVLTDSLPSMTIDVLPTYNKHHQIPLDKAYLLAKWNTPWVLDAAIQLEQPIPYIHKQGAVVWVKL
jgi:ASCH domain.